MRFTVTPALSPDSRPASCRVSRHDGAALASSLAPRLRAVLPEGFEVAVHKGQLRLTFAPTGDYVDAPMDLFLRAPDDLDDAILRAVHSALNTVQDAVSEALKEPWPADSRKGRSSMALPEARVSDGTLTMWFGEAGDPRQELTSLSIHEIQ